MASGHAGGFVPRILHLNPDAKILMDDLGLGVLQEWQRFLLDKGMPNVSFALFDAKRMPLRSNSIDMVSEIDGFVEIRGSEVAIGEAYRVLKAGGSLFSFDSVAEKEDLMELPKEVSKK